MRPSCDSLQCTTGRTPFGQVAMAAYRASFSLKLPGQNFWWWKSNTCARVPCSQTQHHTHCLTQAALQMVVMCWEHLQALSDICMPLGTLHVLHCDVQTMLAGHHVLSDLEDADSKQLQSPASAMSGRAIFPIHKGLLECQSGSTAAAGRLWRP